MVLSLDLFEMDYPVTFNSAPILPAPKFKLNEKGDARFGVPATDEDISNIFAQRDTQKI